MKPDGVSGAEGGNVQPQRKNPQDYTKVDVSKSNELSQHLAGLKNDLQEAFNEMTADGVIDAAEKSELDKWKEYIGSLKDDVSNYYHKHRHEFENTIQEVYLDAFSALRKFCESIDRLKNAKEVKPQEKEQTDTEKREELRNAADSKDTYDTQSWIEDNLRKRHGKAFEAALVRANYINEHSEQGDAESSIAEMLMKNGISEKDAYGFVNRRSDEN